MTALRAGTGNRRAVRLWRLLLVIALLLASAPAGRAAAPPAHTVQPLLLELAAARPDASVSVIVQKLTTKNQIEQLVSTLGGIVTRDLRFINAFAAELPAGAIPQLAAADGIRWVSLNAPVHEMQTNEVGDAYIFTTWATRLGQEGRTEFAESHKLVDSSAGPNGHYAFGSDHKAYVSGFAPQIVPEHSIVKVEVVLFGFAAVPLRDGDETEITVYFDEDGDGDSDSDGKMKFGPRVFDAHAGAANAGPIYIDVTQTSADWDWTDLTNGLEIKVDQSDFESKHYVHYDAVGLRVTSVYSPVFTTWASALGTKVTSTFSLPESIIDAPVGPAGTSGTGAVPRSALPDSNLRSLLAM
ncbi:MAG: hypothetical protein H3C34_14140 [Caldilineaceae bacterium]|nr:hypothetical protein [Caldilineaceae bacterium]